MTGAMQRDPRLTKDQVRAGPAHEATMPAREQRARTTLGAAFAGAWVSPAGDRIVVASTDGANRTWWRGLRMTGASAGPSPGSGRPPVAQGAVSQDVPAT